jgi:hypothetical protein
MPGFDSDVVDAVLAHMNDDHRDDNVLIVRAFAGRHADAAVMSDLDGSGGTWRYTFEGEEHELHLPWSEETDRAARHPAGDRRALRRGLRAARRRAAAALSGREPAAVRASPNRLLATALGIAYVVIGVAGFFVTSGVGFFGAPGGLPLRDLRGEQPPQRACHVVIGAALAIAGLSGTRQAKAVNSVVGTLYLLIGLAGLFVVGSVLQHPGLNGATTCLHFGSAALLLAVALGAERPPR